MKSPFNTLYLQPIEKKTPHVIQVALVDHSGRYKIGPPTRPDIRHDNGHLDYFQKREPTAADRISFAEWVAILEGAEALCTKWTGSYIPICGGELPDANSAYRHFLFGKGKDREIDYDRFLENDPAGKLLLPKLFTDFKYYAAKIGRDRTKYSLTSDIYVVSNNEGFFEAPRTINWIRAIGVHQIWISADVIISAKGGKIHFDTDLTIHMEDRYNFNYKQKDSKSGIEDAANGRFELCGLAKQYTTYGTSKRRLNWETSS
jgi:hypothetical protein